MKPTSHAVHILIVENDVAQAEALIHALNGMLPEGAVVNAAYSVREAMSFLDRDRYHALIVTQDLPDGRGSAFLRPLLMVRGKTIAFFLAARCASSNTEVVGLLREYPQVAFVEAPYDSAAVARRVGQVLMPQRATEQSFYGLRLSELIQALSLARRSATLLVLLPDGRMGTISIDKGDIVHATFGTLEGFPALVRIVGCKKGEIRVENSCSTARHTIFKPTQHVLIDIYRILDEEKQGMVSPEVLGAYGTPAQQAPVVLPPDENVMDELDKMFVGAESHTPISAPLSASDLAPDLAGGLDANVPSVGLPLASTTPVGEAAAGALPVGLIAGLSQTPAAGPPPHKDNQHPEYNIPEIDELLGGPASPGGGDEVDVDVSSGLLGETLKHLSREAEAVKNAVRYGASPSSADPRQIKERVLEALPAIRKLADTRSRSTSTGSGTGTASRDARAGTHSGGAFGSASGTGAKSGTGGGAGTGTGQRAKSAPAAFASATPPVLPSSLPPRLPERSRTGTGTGTGTGAKPLLPPMPPMPVASPSASGSGGAGTGSTRSGTRGSSGTASGTQGGKSVPPLPRKTPKELLDEELEKW